MVSRELGGPRQKHEPLPDVRTRLLGPVGLVWDEVLKNKQLSKSTIHDDIMVWRGYRVLHIKQWKNVVNNKI